MLETRSDDLFLPSYQDEQLVDDLLSCDDSDRDLGGPALSLAEALLPLVDSSSSPTFINSVCSTRYKTELCTSYSASGFCKYAERCQFAHGLHELHVPCRHPKYKTELCRGFHTTGYCFYGGRCLFVHGGAEQRPALRRRRNVPCRTFLSFGVCPFGTRCNFLHVEAGGGVGSGSESPATAAEEPPFPVSSPLPLPVSSPLPLPVSSPLPLPLPFPQAKEWKPRGALCRTFSSFGFCLYGTRCRFQHGLPNKVLAGSTYPQPYPGSSGSPSPTSLFASSSPLSSSSSSSPPSASPLATPPEEAVAHNAFTFSSQHLSDLLLPLAIRLQQLECSQGQEIWANRAL